jgi:hypothetical protein
LSRCTQSRSVCRSSIGSADAPSAQQRARQHARGPGQIALSADPALVLEPDLEPLAGCFLADGSGDPVGKFF